MGAPLLSDVQVVGFRSSLPEVFYKKGVPKYFAKITGNTCGGVSFE